MRARIEIGRNADGQGVPIDIEELRHASARAGQFGLGKIAPAAPFAGTERGPRPAGGDRPRGRFQQPCGRVRPYHYLWSGAFAGRDRSAGASGAAAPRLGRAGARGTRGEAADSLRRAVPHRAVRTPARALVSRAGGGGRGADIRPAAAGEMAEDTRRDSPSWRRTLPPRRPIS